MDLRRLTSASQLSKTKNASAPAEAKAASKPSESTPKGLDAKNVDALAARAESIRANARSLIDPGKSSDVVIGFEQGDTNAPVVVGALWNGADRPPTEATGGPERPSYFDGRTLDANDLADEQDALRERDDDQELGRPHFFDAKLLTRTDVAAEQKSNDDD